MDIDLLSKMVKDLILDNDEVSLPGVGTFVAEMVPASFSDRGYTINPPYRRLYFRQRTDASDMALADLYAAGNGVDREKALQILTDFLAEMKEVLKAKKTIVFPGLGRLRATKENNFFFVADGDLDIYPAGYGLEPISLRTHEETPEEVSSVVEGLRSLLAEPVQPVTAETTDVTPSETESEESTPASVPAREEPVEEIPVEKAAEMASETVITNSEAVAKEVDKGTGRAEEIEQPETVPEKTPETVDRSETKEGTSGEVEQTEKKSETDLTEETVQPENIPDEADRNSGRKSLLYICLGLLGAAIAALLLFVILSRVAPSFIDSLLYSPEELELIRSLGSVDRIPF